MALTKNPDPAPILVEGSIEEVFRRLEIWIGHASKGLSRVEFFSEFARQRVVQFLRNSLEKNSIPFHEIHLPCEETPSRFAWNFLDRLKEIPYGVVSVTGFPNPLLAVHPVDDYLRALNFNRENIAHNAIRQIWWISTPLLDRLVHVAPDLDSWFVLRMQLTESVQPSHELQSLMQPLDRPYVSLEEARKRADYLKERFTNAIRNNAPAGDILTQLALPAVQALHDAGADKEAKELGTWMLEQLSEEELQKEDDPNVGQFLINLANIYRNQGNIQKAEILIKRALKIAEYIWDDKHTNYASALNNLANLYHDQGNYADAETYYKRAIALIEEKLGAEHPELAPSLNNLAVLYCDQKKYIKAAPILSRVNSIIERSVGSNHPNFASALSNMANLYLEEGNFSEAEKLIKRAILIDKKVLEPAHPQIARHLNQLAYLYDVQGKYDEAEPYYQKAITVAERSLGSEHLDVAVYLNNLSEIYSTQHKYDKAEPLFQRAIKVFESTLSYDHPYLVVVYENYADLLNKTGRENEAAKYKAKAAAIQKQREEMQSESGLTG